MKTYFSDFIPKVQRFSKKLDILTLLTNQQWVLIDDDPSSRNVYIFRDNNELLISQTGKVEKARWEYLNQHYLLLETKNESYLFKHYIFEDYILVLQIDGKNDHAFLVNENKSKATWQHHAEVIEFLEKRYPENPEAPEIEYISYDSDKGVLKVERYSSYTNFEPGKRVYLNGLPAPSGKYQLGFMWYVHIENGKISKVTML